ncbi:acetyl-CoA hydrolase/transferase C-terminal domain-containing protein [Halorarius litoreus]|uniref:acetyl-CoA hydrolase/transferase C-terminal domain-containing protein n=1 Tax=Halorarius litoreus TaxID=2962676 RepID=UPI0020CDECA4|nr:acetyl-CoA hydrolase/transferase C-terminal domain-containing protein [Halorarius litoreus]
MSRVTDRPLDRLNGEVPVVSASEAATLVPDTATVAVSGFGRVGYPKAVPLALAESGRDLSLTVLSGGSVGEEIDTELLGADAIARRFPYQATPEARAAANSDAIAYQDRQIEAFGDEVQQGQYGAVDVAVVEAVAIGEDWLVPSTSLGHTPACIAAAERLVVEVNEVQPVALRALHDVYVTGSAPTRQPVPLTAPGDRIGGPRIEFDPAKLAAVVVTEQPDSPYSFREPTAEDEAIAANLATFLSAELEQNEVFAEAVRLQFGVGSLGNALMGEIGRIEFGDRDVAYYGEVVQDGLLDLVDDGSLSAVSATSLALSEQGQQRLFEDIERYAERIVLRPADVTNGAELVRRLGVVAVNSALEVDLYGHVNSTHIDGTHVVNGIGGSADFFRNGTLAIVALASTARDGTLNRIVPRVGHVDHTEHDIDVVITEQGVADLRGSVPRERAASLVEQCAHPSFRPTLDAYLDRANAAGGHEPHGADG